MNSSRSRPSSSMPTGEGRPRSRPPSPPAGRRGSSRVRTRRAKDVRTDAQRTTWPASAIPPSSCCSATPPLWQGSRADDVLVEPLQRRARGLGCGQLGHRVGEAGRLFARMSVIAALLACTVATGVAAAPNPAVGTTTRISTGTDGQSDNRSEEAWISANGRHVLFLSEASEPPARRRPARRLPEGPLVRFARASRQPVLPTAGRRRTAHRSGTSPRAAPRPARRDRAQPGRSVGDAARLPDRQGLRRERLPRRWP